jgi:hypothetical protein
METTMTTFDMGDDEDLDFDDDFDEWGKCQKPQQIEWNGASDINVREGNFPMRR